MLILSRKVGEELVIMDNIVVSVTAICGQRVKLGIVAPRDVPVHRREVYEAIRREKMDCPQARPVTG